METLSRRNPSDEMFDEELSIKHWIANFVGDDGIIGIVDAKLLSIEDRLLNYCEDNPEDRLGMSDVLGALKNKLQFLAYDTMTTTSIVR
ncbi:UNVERIFIED_CONTAM: hypothetical protein Scaly_2652200 [Sesamum calycinum]|uniref:Uncharacterized protein n=1 Tax=Sesamum calycinum TaxID=2727403 RepID=A0AAW2J8V6_9LAMI